MRRLLYLIPIVLYLAFYGISYNVLENRIPPPVNATLPTPHYVSPELKPLVDRYQLYGVDFYLNPEYNWREGQWGAYLGKKIYVRDIGTSLEIALTHEYVHHKQVKSPPIDWKPMYIGALKRRMLTFYPEYQANEVEAVACTEVASLPEPYLTRCNSLVVNRNLLPFRL